MNMHDGPMDMDQDQGGNDVGNHGMLLFGDEQAFLSHLPMFMAPHNYQAFLAVSLTKPGGDPLAEYRHDRARTGTGMYSFVPDEDFALTDLAGPDPAHPQRTAFPGTIWRGHFEPGHFIGKGMRIIEGVTAHVTQVIYFQKLDPAAGVPQLLEGMLVGTGQEVYLIHRITQPPDYDQVVRVSGLNPSLTGENLLHTVPVVIPGRPNTIEERLTPSASGPVTAEIQSRSAPGSASVSEVSFVVGDQLYFETNDLAQ